MTVHFENGEEGIVQTVDLEKVVEIPVKQMSEEELAKYKQEFVKPFDLGTGPLYRFEIVTTEKQTYLLMDVHHLVFDGGSSDVFLQQLCSIMNGETIEDEAQSYAAYVMTEKAAEGGTEYQAAADFFKERLSEVEAVTEVQSDLLGLDKITQQGLTVINCVANVKHFSAGNDIEMVNIESVRHLIAFCLRTGSRLIHISTNSIAGMSIDGKPGPEVKLTEHTFNIGQDINANKYVYSKYKAEELVLEAIAHHGLNAKIMRVGNLSARQKDGEFQINFNTNNFLARLRAYVVIGMVPYEALNQRFEFSPIDEVAHAIMLLSQTPKDCTIFHPNNTHRQFLSDVLIGFAKAGIVLKRVESEEFQQALDRMMDNPDLITLLRPLMAYNLGGNRKVRSIESTNDYTTQVLYRCGFQWPPTAADYVHRFVDTIIGFDYFNVST